MNLKTKFWTKPTKVKQVSQHLYLINHQNLPGNWIHFRSQIQWISYQQVHMYDYRGQDCREVERKIEEDGIYM